jgi:hypothetical protein
MNLTDFHAKYFAHELTKRSPSESVEMLAGVLADAQVDLNPHQIDACFLVMLNGLSVVRIVILHRVVRFWLMRSDSERLSKLDFC